MKARVAFNMLNFAKRLKEAGVEPKIAEAQAQVTLEVIVGLLEENLATKQDFVIARQDMDLFKQEMKQDMIVLKQEMKQDIALLKQDMKVLKAEMITEIRDTELRLERQINRLERVTYKVGGIVAGAIGVINTTLHFLR